MSFADLLMNYMKVWSNLRFQTLRLDSSFWMLSAIADASENGYVLTLADKTTGLLTLQPPSGGGGGVTSLATSPANLPLHVTAGTGDITISSTGNYGSTALQTSGGLAVTGGTSTISGLLTTGSLNCTGTATIGSTFDIKSSGTFKYENTPIANAVLTSDGAGNGTWTAVPYPVTAVQATNGTIAITTGSPSTIKKIAATGDFSGLEVKADTVTSTVVGTAGLTVGDGTTTQVFQYHTLGSANNMFLQLKDATTGACDWTAVVPAGVNSIALTTTAGGSPSFNKTLTVHPGSGTGDVSLECSGVFGTSGTPIAITTFDDVSIAAVSPKGLKITSGAGLNKVLTCTDAVSGLAQWSTLGTFGVTSILPFPSDTSITMTGDGPGPNQNGNVKLAASGNFGTRDIDTTGTGTFGGGVISTGPSHMASLICDSSLQINAGPGTFTQSFTGSSSGATWLVSDHPGRSAILEWNQVAGEIQFNILNTSTATTIEPGTITTDIVEAGTSLSVGQNAHGGANIGGLTTCTADRTGGASPVGLVVHDTLCLSPGTSGINKVIYDQFLTILQPTNQTLSPSDVFQGFIVVTTPGSAFWNWPLGIDLYNWITDPDIGLGMQFPVGRWFECSLLLPSNYISSGPEITISLDNSRDGEPNTPGVFASTAYWPVNPDGKTPPPNAWTRSRYTQTSEQINAPSVNGTNWSPLKTYRFYLKGTTGGPVTNAQWYITF